MWIVDASVIVKWFFTDEPLRAQSLELQKKLVHNPLGFACPHLFYAEIIHVFSRKSGKNLSFVQEALGLITSLGIPTIFLTAEGLQNAAQFTCRGLSGYDASYLALAKQLRGRWVTADAKAAQMAPAELVMELGQWSER